MSLFFAVEIHQKTVAALMAHGHEVRRISFPRENERLQREVLNNIYTEHGMLLTSDSQLAARLNERYSERPGIVVCPAQRTNDAVVHTELGKIIHSVVSARERMDGHTNGLLLVPQLGGVISSTSKRLVGTRPRKRHKQ